MRVSHLFAAAAALTLSAVSLQAQSWTTCNGTTIQKADFTASCTTTSGVSVDVPYLAQASTTGDVAKVTVVAADLNAGKLDEALIDKLVLGGWPRGEKVAHKDVKLRTFISQEKNRMQMASHVYDISYGTVRDGDTLVCVDDSIVRGTTLRQSILRILARPNPKRIVIASTAPQIRYPDCYGIDMSEMGKFLAFQAAVALCKDRGMADLLREVYEDCVAQSKKPTKEMKNHVKRIYDAFAEKEIAAKAAELAAQEAATVLADDVVRGRQQRAEWRSAQYPPPSARIRHGVGQVRLPVTDPLESQWCRGADPQFGDPRGNSFFVQTDCSHRTDASG